MPTNETTEKAKEFLTGLYQSIHDKQVVYYTLPQSLCLHEKVLEISGAVGLSKTKNLELAALFHNIRYWQTEERPLDTQALLKEFKKQYRLKIKEEAILALIKSPEDHNADKSEEEAILYDAYLSYLGEKKIERNIFLKAKDEENDLSAIEIKSQTLKFMELHNFRTGYAINNYGNRKAKNGYKLQTIKEKALVKKSKKKRNDRKLGRGIETMYRAVYRNHINLSAIADGKANLIISVNTIILSVIITLAGTGYTFFDTGFFKYARFTIPVILLLMSLLTAVIFAVLSARPDVTKKKMNRDRLLAKKSSILFFGNFATIEQDDFVREMSIFRQNQDRLYDSMSVDLYQLGKVLYRKYRLVKVSYNVFMFGLAASVISFLIVFIYSQAYITGA